MGVCGRGGQRHRGNGLDRQEELRPQGTKEIEKADDFCSSFNLEWE